MDIIASINVSTDILDRSVKEREFIHDLSNKLQVAFGMSELSVRSMKDSSSESFEKSEEDLLCLKKSLKCVIDEIKVRRIVLHGISKVQIKSTMIK